MAKLTKAQRAALASAFNGLCAYCGQPLGARWHSDHKEPVLRNYAPKTPENPQGMLHLNRDTMDNQVPACSPCNLDKASMTLEQWRAKLERSVASLQRYSSTWRHALRFGLVAPAAPAVVFYFERATHPQPEQQGGGE